MIKLDEQVLCHAKDQQGEVECSEHKGYLIDDAGGLAEKLGFHNAMLSKVDYFRRQEADIQLIELTDLAEVAIDCHQTFNQLCEERRRQGRLSGKEQKALRRQAWQIVTDELKLKWNGSIAVIERLLRKNKEIKLEPNYELLIVCKNHTDVQVLDGLKGLLAGMMGRVSICTTKDVEEWLLGSNIL